MILLIGGNGFIGRHFAALLRDRGFTAAVVTRRTATVEEAYGGTAPVVDAETFAGVAGDRLLADAEAVVYLASASVPSTFAAEPWREVPVNVEPAARFFARCAAANPSAKLVLISSGGTVYGRTAGAPVPEDAPTWPISGYGLGKLMIEQALAFVGRTRGVAYSVLRVSNAVGRWQSNDTQGIVSIALRAARDRTLIDLYGGGSQVRDYVDADDVADALLAACLDRRHVDRIWNVGSGIGRSVAEMIRLVEEVTGRTVPVRDLPARSIDVAAIVLDCSRIRRDLNWMASRPITATIADVWHSLGRHPQVRTKTRRPQIARCQTC
jgi:UDP-glucose 4-epimerase